LPSATCIAATVDRFRVLDELRRDSARLQFLLEEQVAQRTASLQESNDQLDAFVYTVSHDLRAPLRAMEGFARILLDDFSERLGAEGQRYASRVVGAAKRMELLIDDLLTFSRVQRSELAPQTLDTARIVEGAVNEVQQATVDQRRVSIVVIPPLPSVQGDRTIFRQIIINLLANAVKFHDSAGPVQVVVRAEQNGQRVRLWVEDNGIGIAPQHQERIFNVFERLHGQEAYPGTGIGLAIVKAGIARMGGTCGVESALGHGSRFWIELAHLDNVSVSTCNQGPD
jgi:signal transduction histidine kinase